MRDLICAQLLPPQFAAALQQLRALPQWAHAHSFVLSCCHQFAAALQLTYSCAHCCSKTGKASSRGEKKLSPTVTFDSKTASTGSRAGSKSFPEATKKFKTAGRKRLVLQEHLSHATELPLEPGRSRHAPSHWLDSRSATWSYTGQGEQRRHTYG